MGPLCGLHSGHGRPLSLPRFRYWLCTRSFKLFLGIDSASGIPFVTRPAARAVGYKWKRPPTNSDEIAIWDENEYGDVKNDLQYQIEELKTRIERNKAATHESNLKGQFWKKAAEALKKNQSCVGTP